MNILKLKLLTFFIMNIDKTQSIFCGEKAEENEFINLVVIDLPGSVNYCSGIIINPSYVLTAGHCVLFGNSKSYLIYRDMDSFIQNRNGHWVHEVYIHEDMDTKLAIRDHDHQRWINDIALILVEEPFDSIARIPLSIIPAEEDLICKLVGFGAIGKRENGDLIFPDTLNWANVTVMDSDECYDHYSDPNEICTCDVYVRATASVGDDGGALLCSGILIGIISSSKSNPMEPVRHIQISSHFSFLHQIISAENSQSDDE